jgi:hypothetical protein
LTILNRRNIIGTQSNFQIDLSSNTLQTAHPLSFAHLGRVGMFSESRTEEDKIRIDNKDRKVLRGRGEQEKNVEVMCESE